MQSTKTNQRKRKEQTMKLENDVQTPTTESPAGRVLQYARRVALSGSGKLVLATAMLAAMLALAALLVSGVPGQAQDQQGQQDGLESRIRQGFAIAPVPLNLAGKNRALVGLGSYIVNAQGGCNDCHTTPNYVPGHDPFKGEPLQVNAATYLGGGRTFGPVIVARNITPDDHGLPSGLTRDQFITAMRTGIDKDGAILQVMPWPVFADMTDGDLKAIYEYLSSIPRLEGLGPRDP
jgi:hypothetical protein